MMAVDTDVDEPLLTVRPQRKPFFLRHRFLRAFIPAAALAVIGFALLVPSYLLLPFEQLVTVDGVMGATAAFFKDDQVSEILLHKHHMRVSITIQGSLEAVRVDLDSVDFEFPSGQVGALLLGRRMEDESRETFNQPKPFRSPIVLATYREYAETLVMSQVATPKPDQGDDPIYYDLDLSRFLMLFDEKKTWNDLGIRGRGGENSNLVLASTTSPCKSNGAATYLGMVACVRNPDGGAVSGMRQAESVAAAVRPFFTSSGLPTDNPEQYFDFLPADGFPPIIVLYEHQYLDHQLKHVAGTGTLDQERVLLYPTPTSVAETEFIPLTVDGDNLGRLITDDPELRRRATELGFRLVDPIPGERTLPELLNENGVPVPVQTDATVAALPRVRLLETMIERVGGEGCS
ncbi:MAG: hypothetical protein ACRDRK_13760 [Pseudonocardia sp.]